MEGCSPPVLEAALSGPSVSQLGAGQAWLNAHPDRRPLSDPVLVEQGTSLLFPKPDPQGPRPPSSRGKISLSCACLASCDGRAGALSSQGWPWSTWVPAALRPWHTLGASQVQVSALGHRPPGQRAPVLTGLQEGPRGPRLRPGLSSSRSVTRPSIACPPVYSADSHWAAVRAGPALRCLLETAQKPGLRVGLAKFFPALAPPL